MLLSANKQETRYQCQVIINYILPLSNDLSVKSECMFFVIAISCPIDWPHKDMQTLGCEAKVSTTMFFFCYLLRRMVCKKGMGVSYGESILVVAIALARKWSYGGFKMFYAVVIRKGKVLGVIKYGKIIMKKRVANLRLEEGILHVC